jgi:hypothetical protein
MKKNGTYGIKYSFLNLIKPTMIAKCRMRKEIKLKINKLNEKNKPNRMRRNKINPNI